MFLVFVTYYSYHLFFYQHDGQSNKISLGSYIVLVEVKENLPCLSLPKLRCAKYFNNFTLRDPVC